MLLRAGGSLGGAAATTCRRIMTRVPAVEQGCGTQPARRQAETQCASSSSWPGTPACVPAELRPLAGGTLVAAEVLFDAPDLSRKVVIIDRGSRCRGVVARARQSHQPSQRHRQVTQVCRPQRSAADGSDAAIPVLNARTQRGAAFSAPAWHGAMLRFASGNTDVQPGDALLTGRRRRRLPPGCRSRVSVVDRRVDSKSFARMGLQPGARPTPLRHVLVLEPFGDAVAAPRPPAEGGVRWRAGRRRALTTACPGSEPRDHAGLDQLLTPGLNSSSGRRCSPRSRST